MEASAWPDPASLQTYEEITAAMLLYEQAGARIDDELNEVLADKAALDSLLEQFDGLLPTLGRVETDVRDLAMRVDNTAQVAGRISGQVRRLDEEQSRVKDSIDTLQAIQDLKTAISSTATAMDKEDWESATRNIQRALGVEESVIISEFAEAVVPTAALPNPPAQTLQELKQSMLETFLAEFKKASEAKDEANTSRYFKLFPMINHSDAGLEAYSDFVCGLVSSRQHRLQNPNGKQSAMNYFPTMLTPLFEQIAVIISQHQPVVEKYYGHAAMLKVIRRLQQEADVRALSILNSWSEERNLDRILSSARAHKFTFLNSLSASLASVQGPTLSLPSHLRALNASFRGAQTDATQVVDDIELQVDPKEVDQVVSELATFSARWQIFRRFIHARTEIEDVPISEEQPIPSIAEESKFHLSLQDKLDTAYAPLELWYLRIGTEKAHAIDEPDLQARPVVSSALDDVFFILKKVLGRLVATANVATLTVVCQTLRTSLERDFAHIMRRRIEAAATALSQVQGRGDERDRKEREFRTLFLVYMNDLDLASVYLRRLLSDYTSETALQQAFFLPIEQTQARAAFAHLSKAEDAIKTTTKAGLEQMFNQMVRSKIRPIVLECYKDVTYALDEDGYADADYNNYVGKRFLRAWDTLVEPFREALSEGNYQAFFTMAVTVLVRPWEAVIKGMRFSELGALRFDHDLRTVVSQLSGQTQFGTGPLREAFTRLQQVATLLSADPDDVNELVSTNGWRLTHSEMASFLALKTT